MEEPQPASLASGSVFARCEPSFSTESQQNRADSCRSGALPPEEGHGVVSSGPGNHGMAFSCVQGDAPAEAEHVRRRSARRTVLGRYQGKDRPVRLFQAFQPPPPIPITPMHIQHSPCLIVLSSRVKHAQAYLSRLEGRPCEKGLHQLAHREAQGLGLGGVLGQREVHQGLRGSQAHQPDGPGACEEGAGSDGAAATSICCVSYTAQRRDDTQDDSECCHLEQGVYIPSPPCISTSIYTSNTDLPCCVCAP